MTMDSLTNTASELFGYAAAAVVAAVVGAQKLLKGWSRDRLERVAADAQTAAVIGLREENDRLSAQNGTLAEALNEMQLRVARIAGEAARLAEENLQLKTEIEQLQAQITRLIAQIHPKEA